MPAEFVVDPVVLIHLLLLQNVELVHHLLAVLFVLALEFDQTRIDFMHAVIITVRILKLSAVLLWLYQINEGIIVELLVYLKVVNEVRNELCALHKANPISLFLHSLKCITHNVDEHVQEDNISEKGRQDKDEVW